MTNKGVDISVIQGNVDFAAIKASGVDFVVCRAGVGNGGIDIDYAKNVANATAAGLKVMAYHFIYPLPPNPAQPLRDPVKQAGYHFNAVQGQLAAIDCEWPAPQDFGKWGCTPAQINQWMIAYFTEYTRLDNGRKPLIYTYPYWSDAVKFDPFFAQFPLWIASYQATPFIPHPWTDWTMWQTTAGGGHLPNGAPVDTDVIKDLSLWDSPQTVIPPSPPDVSAATAPPVIFTPPPNSPAPPPTDPLVNLFTNIKNSISNLIKK